MSDTFHLIFATRGGVTAVAKALNISLAAVSQWRDRGEIPENRKDAAQSAIEAHLATLGGPVAPGENLADVTAQLAAFHRRGVQ